MSRKRRNLTVLTVMIALMIMLLPVSEAGAKSSASDFEIEGSTLVRYRGTDKEVTIPDTVEIIGRNAFEDNDKVERIEFSDSVMHIAPYAFWGCDNLETVILGGGLTEVGDYAFDECTGLSQMVIPSNVSAIGIQAFGACTNLRDITIPKETQNISETAFDGCVRLSIHCDAGSAAEEYAEAFYKSQKDMPGYGEVSNEILPSVSPNAEQPPVLAESAEPVEPAETPVPVNTQGRLLGTTYIVGNRAVVLSDNMRFPVYGNENGQEPGTGDAVSRPEDSQNDRLPKYAIIDGKLVADQAYYRSAKLEEVVLPEGIQEIGEFSYARSSATSVVLPEGVERIGYGAFYHCDSLWKVSLPDTVRCVGPKAFSYTKWVQDFLNEEGSSAEDGFLVSGGVLVAYRGKASTVTVPNGVRVIAGEAFQDHGEIEALTLPDSLRVIGEGAFEGCNSLKQVSFGKNVEEIKDRAFLGNVMETVLVPVSVKKIGLQAFGDARISYEGREAEYTHEASAERLSNAAYRRLSDAGGQVPGVTVTGLEEVFGSSVGEKFKTGLTLLSEADRSYTLKVSQPQDVAPMEAAFRRTFQDGIPDGMLIYDLELTDESGIPLLKLGKQALSVVLPVPDALKGQELQLFILDGNGQLEKLAAESQDVDGVEAVRFETNHPAMVGVLGLGK